MRIFVALGSLLVSVLLAALIVPPFVNWDRFKSEFEAEASRALGHDVQVLGTASLRLLPLTSVTFTDVRLGPENEPLLTARSFTVDVDLAPLLSGDVVIADMRLDRPQIEVRLDDNGALVWPESAQSGLDDTPVAVERLTVSDGILRFRDARYQREVILQDIDFVASADEISGPWRGEGMLRWGAERVRMRLSTGRFRENESFSLRANVEAQSLPFDFSFQGFGILSEGGPKVEGTLELVNVSPSSSADQADFPRNINDEALLFSVEADAQIAADGIKIPAYELRMGEGDDPYIITGEGVLGLEEIPYFQASAAGQQVDVKRLEAAIGEVDASENQDLEGRLELLRLLLVQVPDFPGESEISLSLPAFIAGDAVIRDIEANITALGKSKGWRLKNAKALLPGRTEFRADGVLSAGKTMSYSGALTLASRQPTGFAAWLGRSGLEKLAGITNAGFAANARLNDEAVILDELEIVINDQSLEGRFERRDGVTALSLQGERADLDKLRVLGAMIEGNGDRNPISSLSLAVDEAVLEGVSAQGVKAQGSVKNEEFILESLTIENLQGARITASARWPQGQGVLAGTGQMRIQGPALDGLFGLAKRRGLSTNSLSRFANTPRLSANADITLSYSRRGAAFDMAALGSAGGVEVDAAIENGDVLRAALTAQNAAKLFDLMGLAIVPGVELGRGGLTVKAKVEDNGSYDVGTTLTLRDGYASAAGTLVPELKDGALVLSGSLATQVDVTNLDPFITLSATPLPGFGEGNAVRLSADLGLDQNKAFIQGLEGQVGTSRIQGVLNVESAEINGTLTLDQAAAGTLAALVFEQNSILADLSGQIELAVNNLNFENGVPAAGNVSAKAIIDAGDVRLENVSANWLEGAVQGQAVLARDAEGPLISASGQLTDAGISNLSTALGVPPVGNGRADVSGRFEISGAGGLMSNLTGTGSVVVREGELKGISPATFANILTRADALDDTVLNEQAAAVVSGEVGQGQLSFGNTEFSYSITNGTLRADNIVLSAPKISARLGGRLELASTSYEAQLDATFDPGLERVEGAAPGFRVSVIGERENVQSTTDATGFTTYLAARLAQKRERQFLAQRAAILEQQRIRRTARLYQLKEEARRLAREERLANEERLAREEQERLERLQEEQRRRDAEATSDETLGQQEENDQPLLQRGLDWDTRTLQRPPPQLDFDKQFGIGD